LPVKHNAAQSCSGANFHPAQQVSSMSKWPAS
jgi:hypothetical protein